MQRAQPGRRTISTLLVLLAAGVFAAPAQASFDTFDSETLSPTDGAGIEQPLTSAAAYSTTVNFDNAAFGYDAGEKQSNSTDRTSCLASGGVRFAARTAWMRFRPGLVGSLRIDVTSGYDAIIFYREATYRPRGQASLADFTGDAQFNCQDGNIGGGNETLSGQQLIDASRLVFIEVGVICTRNSVPCGGAEQAAATGGPTTVKLTFTPKNGDGDGVPDTLDVCPQQNGSATNGCVDSDGDGVADTDDQCPGVRGDLPTGCLSTDSDRDGFLTNGNPADCHDGDRDVHPGTAEITNNGKDDNCDGVQAIDFDGDGSLLGADCDDREIRRTPGNPEIRGNTIDENCDGAVAPFLLFGQVIDRAVRTLAGGRKQLTAKVKQTPVGAQVEVRCKASQGCPFGFRTFRVKDNHAVSLKGLEKSRLVFGATVELRIIHPDYVTKVVQYTIRRGDTKVVIRCMVPGDPKPRKTDKCPRTV